MRAAKVPECNEGERAETPSEVFLGGENRAVLRKQDSAGPAKNHTESLINERENRQVHLTYPRQRFAGQHIYNPLGAENGV